MRNYVIRSLLSGLLLLFFMSIVIFVLVRIIPGDPALGILAAKASGERGIDPVEHARLREKMGLNEPMVKQYGLWIANTVTGDLGTSVAFRNKPVLSVVKDKAAVTLQITVVGLLDDTSHSLDSGDDGGHTPRVHVGQHRASHRGQWHGHSQLLGGDADRVFPSEIFQLVPTRWGISPSGKTLGRRSSR